MRMLAHMYARERYRQTQRKRERETKMRQRHREERRLERKEQKDGKTGQGSRARDVTPTSQRNLLLPKFKITFFS